MLESWKKAKQGMFHKLYKYVSFITKAKMENRMFKQNQLTKTEFS